MRIPKSIAAIAIASAATAAPAAECKFETAIYKQPETGTVLRFQPSQKLARFGGATNVFFAEIPGGPGPLMAWVSWNNGESRPTAFLTINCPDDAQTADEIEKCTIWENVMYDVSASGAELLPMESEAPPAKILLPDFGRKLRYFAPFNVEDPPADVFSFDSCGELREGK